MRRLLRARLARVLVWALGTAWLLDDDDLVLLAERGGCYHHAMVEGDDLWVAEQQVQWWLEVGQRLAEYAAHWPECRAVDDCDLRCSCGLLDAQGQLAEAVACTFTEGDVAADLLADRRL